MTTSAEPIAVINSETSRRPTVFQEVYPLQEPYVYAAIVREKDTQKIRYEIIEPTLNPQEEKYLKEIKSLLMEVLNINLKEVGSKDKVEAYLKETIKETVKKYHIKIPQEAVDKLSYYIIRDFVGFGRIDPLMKDQMIEDISTDGVNIPIYVWHRTYESLPTNIQFTDAQELDNFVIRLAYLAGKNVSIAAPILDASLPEGSRVQLTYGKEVTKRGSTFTIRRFKADPLTISDLIAFNTISSEMAAYLWFLIENKASVMVAGGIACGKTTILNCLSMFIKPEMKIVSVEDTQEINLPHENWIPSVVRAGFKADEKHTSTITLYDLLRAAVRQRPDYIIVGEVRGDEAYTLFQAMATGHLGMCTIHAESVDAVIRRLESEPMNIPKTLVAMTNVVLVMERTEINGKPARRVNVAAEVNGIDPKTSDITTRDVFQYNQRYDSFSFLGQSNLLEKNAKKLGLPQDALARELDSRRAVLEWMVKEGIRKHIDVANVIREYYANPKRVVQKARMGLT
ncbi:MAG: type II/IV secretion system ATPase subunit [Candidatus Bathyarchaeia archaeon]